MSGYQPTPQDLDYPAKLTAPAVAAAAAAAPDAAAAAAAAATGDVGATADQGAAATNGAVDAAAAAGAGTSSAAAGDAAAAAGGASADGEAAPGAEPPADAAAEQWYPPVRSALLVLSKLYRSVDARIFSGLAQVRSGAPCCEAEPSCLSHKPAHRSACTTACKPVAMHNASQT